MLHALLHGKLQAGSAEPDLLEDAITSTVLGSLVLVEAWDVLAEALGAPRCDHGPCEAWFWPRLARAEPDAMLRLGAVLLVVEAKYGSHKHGSAPRESEIGTDAVRDQLVREWECVSRDALTDRCPTGLARAVSECTPQLVYLVDARRAWRARLDLRESLEKCPNAQMRLATWQGLYTVLHRRGEAWAGLLLRFLERYGLAAFCGDWAPMRHAAQPSVLMWQTRPRHKEEFTHHAAVRAFADAGARSALARAVGRLAS